MLVNLINEGFGNDKGLNCAQKIFHGANVAYDLKISEDTLKVSAGFGGGICIEDACGAVTGAVMALSYMYTNKEGVELKPLVQEMLNNYTENMGSLNCAELKDKYRTEEIGCKNVILKAAELLDEIVKRESNI